MNKTKLKSYAPAARHDFIRAVTDRAHLLGLSESGTEPVEIKGDVALITGRPYPAKVAAQRKGLEVRIQRDGFESVMEAVAYTWFNRFAALRYMEVHGYLEHGFRVFSNPNGGAIPEILEQAANVALAGLDKDAVVALKLDGNKDAELYRLLLVAQCNALATAMPFLFERIDDETELLLPDNLLHSDSLIRKLVSETDEEAWQQVEIIGWLYQFYISEKKDQVIGKVVKSEDIPAATQLFTPNWIVQYLVQNSVGRLWLMANPQSTLAKEWPYYITPAQQTPEVQAQLNTLIQARIREDGDTLNPESITVLDPACGSGHILVVAYDVLKAIYLERGYQPRAIPRLILEKNLFGLDIDDRAAQMAGFALLMKARADDRRLFNATDDAGNLQPPKLNVLSLLESAGLSVDELATRLAPFKVQRATITALVETFEHAKNFGSLIQIPYALKTHLAVLPQVLALVKQSGDMYASTAADDMLPLVQQAQMLAMQFDAVVANPPYMGGQGMNSALKDYAKAIFPDSKSDLFAMFMERGFEWCKPMGFTSMVTMQSWMFLSSYQAVREKILRERTIQTMAHLGARAFSEISGEVVQTTAFVFLNQHLEGSKPVFIRLVDGDENLKEIVLRSGGNRYDTISQERFHSIPGSLLAYWVHHSVFENYEKTKGILADIAKSEGKIVTSDNGKYIRFSWEVSSSKVGSGSDKVWLPIAMGGESRKWFGNIEQVIDWSDTALSFYRSHPSARLIREEFWTKPGVTWGKISSGAPSFRFLSPEDMYQETAILQNDIVSAFKILGLLNSVVSSYYLSFTSPTINIQLEDAKSIPLIGWNDLYSEIIDNVKSAVDLSKDDWNIRETSLGFLADSIVSMKQKCLEESFGLQKEIREAAIHTLQGIETKNNRIFINAYGLHDELTPEVPESQITLARADREKDSQRLISYAIGCMMGRYSLDEPGLIYAHAGNFGYDPSRYAAFPADADGIVPITDELWFANDASTRIREFLRAVWGSDTLEENMAWLAESLGTKASETPDETIRRYIAEKFFKDHLQTYKRRPIYWLFSSGKQGAFQALVYLHRYNEATLAKMRSDFVVPLHGKLSARVTNLQNEVTAASSTAARNKWQKLLNIAKARQVELITYDDVLRHYADQRISLDLDDGVKINYAKFNKLLAEAKAVTGGTED